MNYKPEAYRRELRLMPIVMDMERRGINLDGPKLQKDTDFYFSKMDELDEEIQEICGRRFDVDSNADLADAIELANLVNETGFARTPTNKRSTSKESLIGAIGHPRLLACLLIRGSLATCLRTFFQPWLVQYNQNGRLFMRWNQIRNYTDTGARTGRISSSPNLQNIPVEWEGLLAQLKSMGFEMERDFGFELPSMRRYILPDPGKILIGRDYSAQEMKLLAHFSNGKLLEELRVDPNKDIHLIAAGIAGITRKVAKTLGFAVLYGAGVGRIAESLNIGVAEATGIKKRYLAALPEIAEFQRKLTSDAKCKIATETLGGRYYYPPKPAFIGGRMQSFEYRLTNYKIQGSAADQTKQAMIDYDELNGSGELILTVHDQLVIQCPIEDADREALRLEQAMNNAFQDTLRYKITSDGERGYNFAEMTGDDHGTGLTTQVMHTQPQRLTI